jgi:hypothetical protein
MNKEQKHICLPCYDENHVNHPVQFAVSDELHRILTTCKEGDTFPAEPIPEYLM